MNDKTRQIINVLLGMCQSRANIVLLSDKPSLWMQYYMGIVLEMPTVLVIRKKEKEKLLSRLAHPLIVKIIYVDDFNQVSLDKINEEIADLVKKEYEKSKS